MIEKPQEVLKFTNSRGASCTVEIGSVYTATPKGLYYCLIKENQQIVAEGAFTEEMIETIKKHY